MGEIQRPGALYQQVAAEIRSGITSGEYQPGSLLPSEAQLMTRYKVSRPTVRKAIDRLRAEGLIDVIHGKGSYVRALPAPAITIDRGITRTGDEFQAGNVGWQQPESPTIYRTTTTATTAPLLGLAEEEALFAVDRLLSDPKSGTRALHRTLIPFATAANVAEELGERPDMEPEEIYAVLTAAGQSLTWTETVSARMPLPDERTTLDIPDATPILHTIRITRDEHGQPLILEELRTSAHRAQVEYVMRAEPPQLPHPV
ncbi:GntR family transcriptional regulator [Streptomyces xiamenensis]|uniref:GntR family transcriptional regulator n=1 Tax=Streptomyces xiamenensis TaxID=408015 RepID=UPI0036E980A5